MSEKPTDVRLQLSPELIEREKVIRQAAKDLNVPYDTDYIFGKAFTEALDQFEINDLAVAGYARPRGEPENGLAGMAECVRIEREDALVNYMDAQDDHKSLHSICRIPDTSPEGIKHWNRMFVRHLADGLSLMDIKFTHRKLKRGIDDLVIKKGWKNHRTFAESIKEATSEAASVK